MYWEIIGYLGIFFGVIYKVPQILKLCRSKRGEDISKRSFLLQNLAYIAFTIYLFSKDKNDYILISYEFIGLFQNCLIIGLKIHYKKREQLVRITAEEESTNDV